MQEERPNNPVGPFEPIDEVSDATRNEWIASISALPRQLRAAVDGLAQAELDTKYRNWTVRQIVHHIADSHVNSYIRFKWTLTEETPTIKAYDEGLWSDLVESRTGDVGASLAMLDGLHSRWVQLMKSLTATDWDRSFVHPETQSSNTLISATSYYAWHGRHHTGQILWLKSHVFA